MMKEWINTELPSIADELELQITAGVHVEADEGLNITGRKEVYHVLDDILAVLFPGAYSEERVDSVDLNFYINDKLRHICKNLMLHTSSVFAYHCNSERCPSCNVSKDSESCDEQAKEVSTALLHALPEIRSLLLHDIKSGLEGDPASQSYQEIILSYPFVEAVATHRVAHKLYELGVPVIPRIMAERAHSKTGIDIHPGANIGKGFFIDHGTGLVIGETCNIGENVTIYHGVTLGAFSPYDREGNKFKGAKRHPDIGDNVIIYSGAVILGGETVIGKNSVIGGNAWITRSVPPNSMVYSKFDVVFKEDAVK